MTEHRFGLRSLAEIAGVHPDLVAVVQRALVLSPMDFAVHDGTRTEAEQRELVERGASQTMASRHLTGHAVDLVPYVGGKLRWDWPLLYQVAAAVRAAAVEHAVPIRWGGAWDVTLTDTTEEPEAVSAGYAARRRARGRKPFLDGPHFELPADRYP